MRFWTVVARAGIGDEFMVRGNAQQVKRLLRLAELRKFSAGERNVIESVDPALYARLIRGDGQDAVRRQPLKVLDLPCSLRHLLGILAVGVNGPQARQVSLAVGNLGIVLVFFFLLLSLRLWLGGEKGQVLTIGRPAEGTHGVFAGGDRPGFTAVQTNYIDLAALFSIGKKRQRFTVGRPARQVLGFRR